MPDPFEGEFSDVLEALANTEVRAPVTLLEGATERLAEPVPERVSSVEAAIERDADETWSLCVAFLGDEDAAWEALVAGFSRLAQDEAPALTVGDSVRAVAEAALEVARLLAKGGHQPDVIGASLAPEDRLRLLLHGQGLGVTLEQEGATDLAPALLTAHPRPRGEDGEELCLLEAAELLGTLLASDAGRLESLRREQSTLATLIRERYAELLEVPPLVLARRDELAAQVRAELERASAQQARVGAVRLRVTVTCSFCHDGLEREQAVFCSGCLAPHHEECFRMHGRCSAPGCAHTKIVRPGDPTPVAPEPKRRQRIWPLIVATGLGAAAVAALNHGFAPDPVAKAPPPQKTAPAPPPPRIDPEVLREAEARTAKIEAERAAAAEENAALAKVLDEKQIALNFDSTPFYEAIDFLRDITKLNYVISSSARDLIDYESVEVSLRLKNISLKNALNLILASHENLAYRLDSGVIIIDTYDDFPRELTLEVYDVGGILSGMTKADGGYRLEADKLVELLEQYFGENEDEGSVEITGTTLIVRKSLGAQLKTRKLLAYLRGELKVEKTKRPAWIEAYEAKLDEPVTLNFPDTPLTEVVNYLQDITGLNITLASSVDAEELTVSLRLNEVSLRDGLRMILAQTGLAMSYRDRTLLISQPEAARGQFSLRIVDVADIIGWGTDPDVLEEVIMNAVGEDNWDEPASLDCHHAQLIINQTEHMHEAVEEVIAKMRISRERNKRRKR